MSSSIIADRLAFVLRDPVGSLTYKGRKELHRAVVRWAEHNLWRHGVLNSLSSFVNGRPHGAIAPEYADLWFLYRKVRLIKPKIILEFGSGCSTVTLAQALRDNERDGSRSGGYIYSVDGNAHWAKSSAESMPDSLQKFCSISYSPLTEVEYQGTLGFQHAKVPDVVPDMLYLDGPALTAERAVATDVLDLEDKFPPGFCLVVDGRIKNTMFLKQHLKKKYRFKENKLLFNYVFELVE